MEHTELSRLESTLSPKGFGGGDGDCDEGGEEFPVVLSLKELEDKGLKEPEMRGYIQTVHTKTQKSVYAFSFEKRYALIEEGNGPVRKVLRGEAGFPDFLYTAASYTMDPKRIASASSFYA